MNLTRCAVLLLILASSWILAACSGTSYDRARQSLTGLEQAVRVAAIAVNEHDKSEQSAILEKSKARCVADAEPRVCVEREGQAMLASYLKIYDAVRKVLGAVHAALAGAAATVSAAELAGSGGDVGAILTALAPLARDLADALAALGISSTPTPAPPGGP